MHSCESDIPAVASNGERYLFAALAGLRDHLAVALAGTAEEAPLAAVEGAGLREQAAVLRGALERSGYEPACQATADDEPLLVLCRAVQARSFDELRELAARRIVVSVTSFPERIESLPCALGTIYGQTLPADEVVLWLASEQFPGGEDGLPAELLEFQVAGRLTIRWCPDLKPHKKYFYAFEQFPEDLVVSIDDDLRYGSRLLENLFCSYLLHPQAVSAARTHLMAIAEDGRLLPYENWVFETDALLYEPSMQLFATGGAGALYPPHLIDPRTLDEEGIRETCLFADDVWLKAAEAVSGVPVVTAQPHRALSSVPGSQATALWRSNRGGAAGTGGNDEQLARVVPWMDARFGAGAFERGISRTDAGVDLLGMAAFSTHASSRAERLDAIRKESLVTKWDLFANWTMARIDIKNVGTAANDIAFLEVSDENARLQVPAWFLGGGTGYVVNSAAGSIRLRFRCQGAGTLKIALRGRSVMGEDGKRIPFWIDYTTCELDGKPVLTAPRATWHDKPYRFEQPVEDGQVVELSANWRLHAEAERDDARAHVARQEAEIKRVETELARTKAELEHAEAERARHAAEIEAIHASNTWKAGRVVTWPARALKRLLKRLRGRG